MDHMTPQQLAARLQDTTLPAPLLLDVREMWEVGTAHIEGATVVPMSGLAARIEEVASLQEGDDGIARQMICICHHGARSMQVAAFLEKNGFENIVNLSGGIHAWSLQVDPSVPTY